MMHRLMTVSVCALGMAAGAAVAGGSCGEKKVASACESAPAQAQTVAWGGYGKKMDIVDTAVSAGSFNTLAAALKAAGLIDALKGDGPFTVFAPTDDAFAKLPAGTVENLLKPENRETLKSVLLYHVVQGRVTSGEVVKLSNATTLEGQRVDIKAWDGKVKVDGATVVKADVEASNGVIHVIDSVILPETNTIVGVAQSAGMFSTLVQAVGAAELVSTLDGDGPFTVFAPTDDAFAKLPAGTLESLLRPENRQKLVSVLTYHVVPGRVYSDQVVTLDSATTVQGSPVDIRVKNGRVMVDGATVVKTDIEASNGVIHVIDSVILPD